VDYLDKPWFMPGPALPAPLSALSIVRRDACPHADRGSNFGSDSLSVQSAGYAGAMRRARRRSSLARPYI
jgi:hypothetical protein